MAEFTIRRDNTGGIVKCQGCYSPVPTIQVGAQRTPYCQLCVDTNQVGRWGLDDRPVTKRDLYQLINWLRNEIEL